MSIKAHIKYYLQRYEYRHQQIRLYHFWPGKPENNWFYRFMSQRDLLRGKRHVKVGFYSVYGSRLPLRKNDCQIKVFFTGENVRSTFYKNYADHGLDDHPDISLGFEYLQQQNYLRFPLWILYMIKPSSTYEDVVEFCKKFNSVADHKRPFFASLIARHDMTGLRGKMLDQISSVDFVHAAGPYRNNSTVLKEDFNDDKHAFLQQCIFNICPENSNTTGYVTEKLFQAMAAGCIPVYWGSDNHPEPEIINQDAIVFWKEGNDQQETLEKIHYLYHNTKACRDFIRQPKLLPQAPERIYQFLIDFEQALKECISQI